MKEIVAVDIGGTHARFAIATVDEGRVTDLGNATTLKCAEHASLQLAWEAFARQIGRPLPRAAGIAVACPVQGETLKLTNNPWIIQPAQLGAKLGVDEHVLVNDFGAVGHAVAQVDPSYLRHLCGPDRPVSDAGVTTIVGPGTGLGSAYVVRRGGRYIVCETEGGHVDFAPLDVVEDKILQRLRLRYRRVSTERIVSGPGLVNLYEAIAEMEGQPARTRDDKELWTLALEGRDHMASAALERFCLALGAVAGDLALAQGGHSVVIAGGLGLRLADHLPRSGFAERFVAKGRFEAMMSDMPVRLITHPQPGLFGAAAAFAERFT
ncbi:glucokinase [Nguyenibacter sp. L1]|uniref:glucokinase n=1 Tax=Nguyenibacter sp. L1 TaxID=3049350 RepID=UPI002B48F473|nr:glucokinase [Nguyenibacter sp. L1]WRH88071.1 glucokinase [Nguyenibacter sp. L1]